MLIIEGLFLDLNAMNSLIFFSIKIVSTSFEIVYFENSKQTKNKTTLFIYTIAILLKYVKSVFALVEQQVFLVKSHKNCNTTQLHHKNSSIC